MESTLFLAVTGPEMEIFHPQKLAYMACHFSPYHPGLSNLPASLPPGSILLVDDSMSIEGHDPQAVTQQLEDIVRCFSPYAILLDFQNPPTTAGIEMANTILHSISCLVAVTKPYAASLNCPVFLAPPPVNMPLGKYLEPWKTREIFLEVTSDCLQFTITAEGCKVISFPTDTTPNTSQQDLRLHCHYHVDVFPDRAVFTLRRTREDLLDMAQEALELGVLGTIGFYRELNT